MKIISPNILAINSFLQILEKGIYVYNKKNEELGRAGLPYNYDATRLIKYLPWEKTSDPIIKQSIKVGDKKFGRFISENGAEVIVYYPKKKEKPKRISHSHFIQLAIKAKMLDWNKILKENKERGREQKKKLDKNKNEVNLNLQENYKEATKRFERHAHKSEYGGKVSSAGYDAKELNIKE